MSIRRDYSRPFFSKRRGPNPWLLLFIGVILGGVLVITALYADQLELAALDTLGIAPTPTPYASTLATEGLQRYQSGDIDGALQLLEQAVKQKPDDINYLYEYGLLLIEGERIDEAITIADIAIEAAPDDPRGYALKGQSLMWRDPSTAVQMTILGKDADPNFAPLYAIEGVAYTNLARPQEGIRQAFQAIELDPANPFVLRAIYTPLVYLGRFNEAIDYLEQSISINPNVTPPYFELASLYRHPNVGQPEMALALYDRVLELEPDNAKAYLRICQTYASVEEARFDVAQPYCDEAINIDPDYGDAYAQRGQMQYARRNYEGSIESFNACIARGSERIECWYLRGLAHYFLGDCDRAWAVLQEARPLAQQNNPAILPQIETGLYNVTQKCAGYNNQIIPTPLPSTPLPPTPIGGFG